MSFMRITLLIFLAMTLILSFSVPLFAAQPKASQQASQEGDGSWWRQLRNERIRFSAKDRSQIRDYYQEKKKLKKKELPPGLAKREKLPPGLQKQLARKGTLPPGLAKRRLPHDLEGRLTKLPEGFERVQTDDSVVLIETGTQIILDVITGLGI